MNNKPDNNAKKDLLLPSCSRKDARNQCEDIWINN